MMNLKASFKVKTAIKFCVISDRGTKKRKKRNIKYVLVLKKKKLNTVCLKINMSK